LLPPVDDIGANMVTADNGAAAGQTQQVPGWVWIAAGMLGLVIVMQD